MKTLYILGSPKKNGATHALFSYFNQKYPGKALWVYDKKIKPCIGCDRCKKEKLCFIKDDMVEIYKEIKQAQNIIFFSPIYFFGFPSPLKALIDRTQVFWNHPLKKEKKLLLALLGEQDNGYFKPFYQKSWSYIAHNLGAINENFLLFGNIKKPFVFSHNLLQQGEDFLKPKK